LLFSILIIDVIVDVVVNFIVDLICCSDVICVTGCHLDDVSKAGDLMVAFPVATIVVVVVSSLLLLHNHGNSTSIHCCFCHLTSVDSSIVLIALEVASIRSKIIMCS
jgi:hypothetical protein